MKTNHLDSRSVVKSFLLIVLLLLPAATFAAEGDFLWAHGFGNSQSDMGYSVAIDGAGNVYATGSFNGTVDFDPGPGTQELTSTGGGTAVDVFVCKFNKEGNLVWAKSFGGAASDEGFSIAVDGAGNVYTTGYFFSPSVDFDPDPSFSAEYILTNNGDADIFISKLDSNGNFVGAWTMGGTATDYGYGILVDSTGNIYTTGYFQSTVDFDPALATNYVLNSASVGIEDIFILKLNSDGTFAWAKSIGATTKDVGLGISRYADGYIYITGYFQGINVDFNPDPVGTANLSSISGSLDIFICKFDSSGTFVWAKSMGGPSWDQAEALAIDRSGNVLITGFFNGTVDFNPSPTATNNLISTGIVGSDIFISKLDSNGNYVWAKSMGGTAADVGNDIAVDKNGNVFTIGNFQGTDVDFDPDPVGTFLLSSNGAFDDIFISKLDSSGNFAGAWVMGSASDDVGYGIAVSPSGKIAATGYYQDIDTDFDPGAGTYSLPYNALEDIFIVSLVGSDYAFPWPMFLPAMTGKKP